MTPRGGTDNTLDGFASARRVRRRALRIRVVALACTVLGLTLAAVPVALVLLPYDDEPRSPDGIVVLGGVGQERVDLGIELAEVYDAPLVLSSSATWFANQRGYRCSIGNALASNSPSLQAQPRRLATPLLSSRTMAGTT